MMKNNIKIPVEHSKEIKRAIKLKKKKVSRFASKKLISSGLRYFNEKAIDSYSPSFIIKLYGEVFKSDPNDDYTESIRNKILIRPNQFVYFIGNREKRIVKIGFTSNVDKRLSAIQTHCPFPVSVFKLEKGNIENEIRHHKEFTLYHEYGEWFRIEGTLEYFLFYEQHVH